MRVRSLKDVDGTKLEKAKVETAAIFDSLQLSSTPTCSFPIVLTCHRQRVDSSKGGKAGVCRVRGTGEGHVACDQNLEESVNASPLPRLPSFFNSSFFQITTSPHYYCPPYCGYTRLTLLTIPHACFIFIPILFRHPFSLLPHCHRRRSIYLSLLLLLLNHF